MKFEGQRTVWAHNAEVKHSSKRYWTERKRAEHVWARRAAQGADRAEGWAHRAGPSIKNLEFAFLMYCQPWDEI